MGCTVSRPSEMGYSGLVSKNLFRNKYKLEGKWDEAIKADNDFTDWSQYGEMDEKGVAEYRKMTDDATETFYPPFPEYAEAVSKCEVKKAGSEFDPSIPEFDGLIYVHTPKTLKGTKGNVAFIDYHGGGGIAGDPEGNNPVVSLSAYRFNAIGFCPKYALAPEGKADEMARGIVRDIKHIVKYADNYGIDASKVVLHGCSGGGWAVTVACSQLALNNESHLIKIAVINMFVQPAWYIKTPKDKIPTTICKCPLYDAPFVVKSMATDFEKQWREKDPILFPTEAEDTIIAKWPKTITISAEFDYYYYANEEFSQRLQSNEALLEKIVYPGANHGFFYSLKYKMAHLYWDDMNQIINSYVR
jgi:acetyl esterase/lipase